MTTVVPFNFNGQDVRVVERDGEPWFVAKDVAGTLGYANTRDAVSAHCKGVATVAFHDGRQNRNVSVIPERDVYRLIMRSKLPTAEAFEEWVVGDVLPSIRKTGGFVGAPTIDFSDPIQVASLIAQSAGRVQQLTIENVSLNTELHALNDEVGTLKPKAQALDLIAVADGSMCVTDAAKDLQLRPKDLFNWLSEHRWIYRRAGDKNWRAYQSRIQSGVLEHKVTTIPHRDGTDRVKDQVRVTAKGLAQLAQRFKDADVA